MDVSAMSDRVRSRIRGHRTAPSSTLISMYDNNLRLHSLSFNQSITAGETLTVTYTVSNGALSIPDTNPDCCGPMCGVPGSWSSNGIQYEAPFIPDWTDAKNDGIRCIGTTEAGTVDHHYHWEVTVPEERGVYTFWVVMQTPSGKQGVVERTIQVTERDTSECTYDSDCPDGEVCQNGSCVTEDDGGNNGDDNNNDNNNDGNRIPEPLPQDPRVLAGGVAVAAGAYWYTENQ